MTTNNPKRFMFKTKTILLCLILSIMPGLLSANSPHRSSTSVETGSAEHPFVQTIANIYVNRDSMTVRISSSADELYLIHLISAMENGKYDTEELLEGVEIHGDFLLERFEIYDPAGNRVEGKLVELPKWKIPEVGINDDQLIEYMLDYTFEYAFDEPPEYLTFQNYIIDYNEDLPSEVKIVVKQGGSDAAYADTLKIKDPKTVRFDWDNPLQNHLTGAELKAWFEETRDKTLGLTEYGGVYSFIYVTPREIRHEVLIPLANLNELIRFEQKDRWYLEVDEQDKAVATIEALFSEANKLSVNGKEQKPRFDDIGFFGLDVRDLGRSAERKRVSIANGRAGVIMSYPIRNIPDNVSVSWDMFAKMLRNVEVKIVGPDDSVAKKQFSKFLTKNVAKWTNPGIPPLPEVVDVKVDSFELEPESKAPVLAIVCWLLGGLVFLFGLFNANFGVAKTLLPTAAMLGLGFLLMPVPQSAGPSPETAREIFSDLHTNLFRSFDYNVEEDVYDALARTTDGPLLKKVYLDMRKSLEIKEQGGAVSNIDRIEIMEGEISDASADDEHVDAPDFSYRCIWELEGNVEHWGHIHRRTNRYEALFNVRNIGGLWKITELQAIDQEQGRIIRSVRKF